MIDCGTINDWHIVISGFLQRQGAPNGMLRLAMQLHRELAIPSCMVELRLWHESMAGLAEKIWLTRPLDHHPRIRIYGYSWGGAASIRLADELWDRNLEVEHIVLSDPVYRHRYWLGNWRAFVPFSRLVVPPNVRRVSWFRQHRNLPRGHEVVPLRQDRTQVTNGAIIEATHQYMDDAEFLRKAMEVARS